MPTKHNTKPDKLLRLLRVYRSKAAVYNADSCDLSFEEIDALVTINDKTLDDAVKLRARSGASALAALDVAIYELETDKCDHVQKRILRLTQAARTYFASPKGGV